MTVAEAMTAAKQARRCDPRDGAGEHDARATSPGVLGSYAHRARAIARPTPIGPRSAVTAPR